MLFILLSLLGVSASGIALVAFKIVRTRWRYRHIPSPKSSSLILGHSYDISKERNKGRGDNPIDNLILKWHSEAGDTFVFYNLWNATVMILNPVDIKGVFQNPSIHKAKVRIDTLTHLFGERMNGDGLLSIYDIDKYKKARQIYDEAFNNQYLQTIFPKFRECAEALVTRLRPSADGKMQVAMKKELYQLSMDFMSQVIYSFDFDKEWKGRSLGLEHLNISTYAALWNNLMEGFVQSIFTPFFKYLHPYKARAFRDVARTLRMIGDEWITKRITAMEKGEQLPDDILTRILRLSKARDGTLDVENLVDNFINIHSGGAEPLATILSFAVAHILVDPDVLQQLMSEIDGVLEKRMVTYEDLAKLQYTEQVILETLRLYTLSPVAKESPPEGVTLGKYYIPPGTPITTSIGALSLMPKYYEDPEMFRPSRFNPGNPRPNPHVYFPLGLNPRLCLGQPNLLAMMTLKVVIVRLFQVYQITLPDGYQIEIMSKFLKTSYNEIPCTIVPRK